jgi:hypothetical protein
MKGLIACIKCQRISKYVVLIPLLILATQETRWLVRVTRLDPTKKYVRFKYIRYLVGIHNTSS